ncbi:hypothetical protein OAO65_02215 [Flavobacteriales bacterium]|nr:hypothetical protein [Flavobacteriales bacterium]
MDLSENGIYDVSTTAWSYAKDWNKANDVIAGMLVPSSADIQLYQLKTFTGDYVAGTTEVEFQTGVIASKQYELQLGSQAVAKVFTLTGMTYIPSGNDLIVERNGQVLILDKHYTEASSTTVTIITTVLDADDFIFRSSTGVTLVSTTTASVSHVESGTTYNLATYLQDRHIVNVKDFGAVFDGVTDDTAAINSAVAALHALGGGRLTLPAGATVVTGIDVKSKIIYEGQGYDATLIKVSGSNNHAFKAEAQDTMLSAGNASFGVFKDFQIQFTLGSQAGISYVGLSRWHTENILNLMSGVGATGFECKPTTLTGSGGPSQWYNTFINCFNVGNAAAKASGAVGWDIGGTLSTEEQATSWSILGGRTNLCQVGGWIKGATGINFRSHTMEGCDDSWLVGTTGVGERDTVECTFDDVYIEGGVNGVTFNLNTRRCRFMPSFVTSITGTDYDDSNGGTDNLLLYYQGQSSIPITDYEIKKTTTSNPKVSGTNPAWEFDNGTQNLVISNGGSTSVASQRVSITDGTNSIIKAGDTSMDVKASEFTMDDNNSAITWYAGALNPPGAGIGADGDMYVSTGGSGTLYQRRSGAWVSI